MDFITNPYYANTILQVEIRVMKQVPTIYALNRTK